MSSLDRCAAREERGAITVMMAVGIVLMLGFASFAVDLGLALVTRAELQNSSDAGSAAAVHELAEIYRSLGTTVNYKTYTLTSADKARLQTKATEWVAANPVVGSSLSVLPADIVNGTYDTGTGEITPTDTGVRAISVVSRRDESANGKLPMMLARVIGVDSVPISAKAAFALTPLGALGPGGGEVPIGISSYWFESNACGPGSTIKFYPTGTLDGCAGWHTFTDYPASAAQLRTVLNGLEDGTYVSPQTNAGQTQYNFIGGSVASRFDDMKALYDSRKDASGNWEVTIPVYESPDCSNPNGSMAIKGFATARIYSVSDVPSKQILANVECSIADLSAGSGHGPNDYGTLVGSAAMIQ